ncbi:hypothetical protein AB9F45_27720 [Rhizobium leguminosarum]|uniref:hypothetical protein n=1 Tax=Rhizobium leguminosarum TaxID=384 RepID=UPI000FF3FC52|nr:hypothetical protein [Rhizobium leguminosarum]RWY67863.1 hypothetical protein EHI46_26210 [Rhizobium leguminosarum]
MNIKRGLFRLWLVLSIIYMAAAYFITWPGIRAEFEKAEFKAATAGDPILVPTLCANARGTEKDFSREKFPTEQNPFDTCWYEMPKFRALYPEYKDLSDDALSDKLYTKMSLPFKHEPEPRPWEYLGNISAFAFGIPMLCLAIGSAFVWAFSGFSRRPAA